MSRSTVQESKGQQGEQVRKLGLHTIWLPNTHWTESTKDLRSGSSDQFVLNIHNIVLLLRSQVILFSSRKKWGLLFALATISGMFCLPASADQIRNEKAAFFDNRVSLLISLALPLSTLLIITGMYILNDLFDADLDRKNGKINRPIPSGRVSKRQAVVFVVVEHVFKSGFWE